MINKLTHMKLVRKCRDYFDGRKWILDNSNICELVTLIEVSEQLGKINLY